MRRSISFLVLVGLMVAPVPGISAPPSDAAAAPAGVPVAPVYSWWAGGAEVLFGLPTSHGRRLHGDYEAVDLLLLVHDEDWERSLRTIVSHAKGRAQVEILMLSDDEDEQAQRTRNRRFRAWAHNHSARIREIPHDSPWIRDYGPLQVLDNGVPVWVDYGYSSDRALDDAVPWELAFDHGITVDVEFAYLEGGAVVSNGRGLCAISDRSLLETGIPLDESELVAEFVTRLGCRALTVLPALPHEQTGHTDVTVQFLSARSVAVASMDPVAFPTEARLLDHAAHVLERGAHALNQPLEVVRVPMRASGEIYYSYLNGTRVGDVFFVPSYRGVPAEEQQRVYGQLRRAQPGVRLVPVEAELMVELGGAIHCITLGLRLPPREPDAAPARPKRARVAAAPRLRPTGG